MKIYVWRCSLEIKKLNINDESPGQWNLKRPDKILTTMQRLIPNFYTHKKFKIKIMIFMWIPLL